jgi:hypothetical protein
MFHTVSYPPARETFGENVLFDYRSRIVVAIQEYVAEATIVD